MKTALILFFLFAMFSVSTFAQELQFTTLSGHTADVYDVAYSPDGGTVATGSADGTVRLWNVATGQLSSTLTGHGRAVRAVAYSPDGGTLATGSIDRTVKLWDVATGQLQHSFARHPQAVLAVAYSRDGGTVATGSADGKARLWDVATGHLSKVLIAHKQPVHTVAYSPGGGTLATGSADGTVVLWDVATGSLLKTLVKHRKSVHAVASSPDGVGLAVGGTDGTVGIWNIVTGRRIRTLRGHRGYIACVAYSPDGNTIATGSADNTVRLWNVVTGKRIHTLTGHTGDVEAVAYSPDGNTIATGSADNTVRLSKLPSTRVRVTPHPIAAPAIGEHLKIAINIAAGKNIKGYQIRLRFDRTALRYVESANGDYLPGGAFFAPPVVSKNAVGLGASAPTGTSQGDGTLATVTFEVLDAKASYLVLSDVVLIDSTDKEVPHWTQHAQVIHSAAAVSILPASVASPAIGEHLTFNINVDGSESVTDFSLRFHYNRSALKRIPSGQADALDATDGSTDKTLATVTFEVLEVMKSRVSVTGYLVEANQSLSVPIFAAANVTLPLPEDVNRDGVVNTLDLEQFELSFQRRNGQVHNPADVNRDGSVDILDFIRVAEALEISMEGDVAGPGGIPDPFDPGELPGGSEGVPSEDTPGDGDIADSGGVPDPFDLGELLGGSEGDTPEDTPGDDDDADSGGVPDPFDLGELLGGLEGDTPEDTPGDGDGPDSGGVPDPFDFEELFGGAETTDGEDAPEDVNGDDIVDIGDLLDIAGILPDFGAPPAHDSLGALTPLISRASVLHWLAEAKHYSRTRPVSGQGILFLEQLLARLTPKTSRLLPNYPNPFNPETWIPYRLAADAEVTLTVYDIHGRVVRTLALGYKSAGFYEGRSRAAYWDGRNQLGEPTASGIYFYTLQADDFAATRKMIIRK